MSLALLNTIKTPTNIFVLLGVSVLFFDLQYYLMKNLPGHENFQCIPGANLNSLNVFFSILLSLMTGLMVVAFIELYKRRKMSMAAGSASGLGLFLGTMTVFCTACSLPVISLFGISFSLMFFTEYEILLKAASILLMLVGLWVLNSQLANDCKICKR